MKYLKTLSLYIVISLVLNFISYVVRSDYLGKFLFNNIVLILITLLAINTATSGIIVSRLDEIAKREDRKFTKTYSELKKSLLEQILLIGFAITLSILNDSIYLKESFKYHAIFFNTLITIIFVYSIDILRDTGVSIFLLFDLLKSNKIPKN